MKLKAFNHPWHLAHQFELSKLPFVEWEYLRQYKRVYSSDSRGDFMGDAGWVNHYEKGKYDFALLHLDQQCVTDEIMARGKGRLYVELNEVIQDIPKVVIMHGTPYYPEEMSKEEVVSRVKTLVGDNTMVTNSFQCAKDFGFGTPIIHGFDPTEWWDLPKENRVVTFVSPAGLDQYYDRTFFEAIRDELRERDIFHCHISVDWRSSSADDWKIHEKQNPFDAYREFLGRSLIYLHPCLDSPMPRARTEAMFSGCCILTTPWQDADTFIEHGVNGYIIGDEKTGIPRNPQAVADLVEKLINNYTVAVHLGQEAKKTAIKHFHVDRYQREWADLLEKVLNRKIEY